MKTATLNLSAEIKHRARDLGFDLVGIAPAESSQYKDYFREWLANGNAGEMDYLHRRFDERTDPATYLPGARSVVCVAMNYFVPHKPDLQVRVDPDLKGRLVADAHQTGKVASYALGDDYHELLKTRLFSLADW